MSTYIDKKFDEFVELVKKTQAENNTSFCFDGIAVEFTNNTKSLKGLLKITINGEDYPLEDTLEAKSKLAKDGWLGSGLKAFGQRNWEAVQARIKRNRFKETYNYMKELWGPYTPKVWKLKLSAAKSGKIAHTTRAILDSGKNPKTPGEASSMGIKIPFLIHNEWKAIKKLVAYLYQDPREKRDEELATQFAEALEHAIMNQDQQNQQEEQDEE